MKRLLKLLWKIPLAFLGLIAAYLLAAVVLGVIPTNSNYEPASDGVDLYIKSNPAHVDIVVPIKAGDHNWAEFIPMDAFEAGTADYQYIAFGWGDKGFYLHTPTWADLKASTAVKAVFLPSESAMHVTLYDDVPVEGELCKKLPITDEAYAQLAAFLKSGFALDAAGNSQPIDAIGYGGITDRFFEGAGSYSALKTCNVWTNTALKKAGVTTAVWAPFKEGIFYHHK